MAITSPKQKEELAQQFKINPEIGTHRAKAPGRAVVNPVRVANFVGDRRR
jgi:hypothetical protein